MLQSEPKFFVKIAETEEEFHSAHRLRYEVFVKELGSSGPLIDHKNLLEKDEFDPYFDHLILYDLAKHECSTSDVVGVYRLLRGLTPLRGVNYLGGLSTPNHHY